MARFTTLRHRNLRSLALAGTSTLAIMLFPGTARADELTWDGSSGSDWTNPANWTPGSVPTPADEVVVPAGPTGGAVDPGPIIDNVAAEAKGIEVRGQNTLTVRNNAILTVDGGLGAIDLSARGVGLFTFPVGNLVIGGNSATAPGTIEAAGIRVEPLTNMSGGTVTFSHNSNDGSYLFAPAITGPAHVVVDAGWTVLTGANAYTSGTEILALATLQGNSDSLKGVFEGQAFAFGQNILASTLIITGEGDDPLEIETIGGSTRLVNGTFDFAGGTIVTADRLVITDASVNVGAGATLGTGATAFVAGSTFADGGEPITEIIDSTVTFNPGSTLGFLSSIELVGASTLVFNNGPANDPVVRELSGGAESTLEVGAGTTLNIFNHRSAGTFAGELKGTGTIEKSGAGTWRLTVGGDTLFGGDIHIQEGNVEFRNPGLSLLGLTLLDVLVDEPGTASFSGPMAVRSVDSEGRLTVGDGARAGALTVVGDLTLHPTSHLQASLDERGSAGPVVTVGGNLTVDGVFDIRLPSGHSCDIGLYRVIGYDGTLTDNGADIGETPECFSGTDLTLQTSTPGQVNLLAGSTGGGGGEIPEIAFFTDDEDGIWSDGDFDPQTKIVFQSPITTDGGPEIPVSVGVGVGSPGVQFFDDGISLVPGSGGGSLNLVGPGPTTIQVGDGSAAGAGYTATIGVDIGGSGGLNKTDLGTLVLTGTSTYAGGTLIAGGTILGTTESLRGDIEVLSGATAAFTGVNGTFAGTLGGEGEVTMSYTERMTIASDMVATGLSLGVRVGDVLVVPGDTPGSVRFERVTIDAPASLTVGTGATVEAGTLTGAAGSRVSIATGGVLGVGDGSSIDGLEGGGSLQVAGNVTINGDAPDFTGAIELALASVLTLHVGNGTISGTFAGDGNVIVEADGTLRATTGFGTTLTGTITIRSGGLESELVDMPGTWDVQQDGTLVFQPLLPLGRDESYLGGSLQGTGAVAMAGEGTLVVQSDQILSPDLALEVRSGGLRVEASEPGAVSAFSRVSIVGGAELEVGEDTTVAVGGLDGAVGSLIFVDEGGLLDLDGDCSHAGEIAGAGSLELGCSLTLDANSPDFVGRVDIQPEGTLTINGITGRRGSGDNLDRLVTDTVVRGGVLAGVGLWLGSALAESGGTVAPGNSIGTLSVGAITFAPGSIFEVEVDAAGNSDLLAVSDAATLDGGTVRVLAENGTDDGSTYALETEYTILTAGDGITGTFDEVTEDFAFLSAALTYEANAVTLVLTRDGLTDFCLGAATANQCATGEGVESLGSGPLFAAVLVLSEGEALRAFDALSGGIHASARTALLEDSRFPREAALARMRGAFHAPGGSPDIAERRVSDRFSFWGQGFGAWGDWDGDGKAARLDRSVGGFTMGGDAQVGETMWIGLFGGYSEGSFGVNDRGSSASSDSFHLGAYGGGQWGEFGLRVGGAFGWHDLETGRSVQFGGFAGSLSADYEAHTLQGFAEAGFRLDVGAATLEPFGGLAHVTVRSDAFTEAGGAAALTVARRTTGATFTTLGLRAETRAGLGEANVRLSAMLGWRHAFGDLASGAHRFAAGGTGFSAAGVPLADDTVAVEAGLDLTIRPAVTFGIGYSGQFGRGVSDSGVQARFGIRF